MEGIFPPFFTFYLNNTKKHIQYGLLNNGAKPGDQQKRLWTSLFMEGGALQQSLNPVDLNEDPTNLKRLVDSDIDDYLQSTGLWKDSQASEKCVCVSFCLILNLRIIGKRRSPKDYQMLYPTFSKN